MDTERSPTLETLASVWPIVTNLSQHLPAGDLITLSRSSVSLRALLHGFVKPGDCNLPLDPHCVREQLRVGQHGTLYWQQLKNHAPFECSSRTHTKGPAPKPCRYCSKPICDACIVRSSFSRGHENTFQNRTRYLCKKCWETGNRSRGERFMLNPPQDAPQQRKWYDPDGSTKDYCTCTLKDDGWLCLDCKDLQNWEAISSADKYCHGQDCREPLDDDKERRRICLWCNKALPRQIGGTTRYHWNQKMVEARARNVASRQADIEEYNKRRLKLMRMSRREMRGDDAVRNDPDADIPQFVRHLDTLNYRSYMTESAAPTGDSVYDSKTGYWRYSRDFLLEMRSRCAHVPVPELIGVFNQEDQGSLTFARTNAELSEDMVALATSMPFIPHKRVKQWCTLKAVILEALLVQSLGYKAAQRAIQEEYGFYATVKEYRQMLRLWYTQRPNKGFRRKSLGEEDPLIGSLEPLCNQGEHPRLGPMTDDSTLSATEDPRTSYVAASTAGTTNVPEREREDDSFRQPNHVGVRGALPSEPLQPPGPALGQLSAPARRTLSEPLPPAEDAPDPILPAASPNSPAQSALDTESERHEMVLAEDEEPPPYTPEGWIWP